MDEILIGLVIIVVVFGFIIGLFYITNWMNDVPQWLRALGWIVVLMIAGALLVTCAYVLGASVLAEYSW